MATTNETIDININSSQALASLRSIERNLDTLTNGFRDFMVGVAEGMTGALASTNKTSAGISNMKKNVDALNASASKVDIGKKIGGQAAQANKSISDLDKSAVGLGKRLLGLESIIGALAFTQLAKGAYEYAQANRGASEANLNASMAQDQMVKTLDNLKQAIVNLMEPLNKIIAGIDISASAFESLIKAVLAGAAAFLFFTRLLGPLNNGITILTKGLSTILMSPLQTAAKLFTALGVAISNLFYPIKYAYGTLMSFVTLIKALGLRTAIATFTTLGAVLKSLVAVIVGAVSTLARFVVRFLGIVGIVYAVAEAINFLVKVFFKFDILDWVTGKFSKLIDKVKEWFGLQSNKPSNYGVMGRSYSEQDVKNMEEDIKKLNELRLELSRTAELDLLNTKRQNRNTLEQLILQTKLVGVSDDYAERQRTILEMQQRQRSVVEALQDKLADPNIDNRAKDIIRQQIENYKKLQSVADAAQLAQLQKLQNAKLLDTERLRILERMNEAYERQKTIAEAISSANRTIGERRGDLQFERSLMGQGGFARDLLTQRRELDKLYTEQSQAIAEAFSVDGEIVNVEGYSRAIADLAEKFRELKSITDGNAAAARRWSTGWNEAFETFIDNATNMADVAREAFNGIINNMETALDNFVRTGKLNFKDLVGSIIKDLTSLALRQAFRNLFMLLAGSKESGIIGSFIGSLIGAKPAAIGGATITGARTASADSGGNRPITVQNIYINAIDSRSVAQFFSENRRTAYGAVLQAQKEMPTRMRGAI